MGKCVKASYSGFDYGLKPLLSPSIILFCAAEGFQGLRRRRLPVL